MLSHAPHRIAAETIWNQIQDSEQRSVIIVATDPPGHESLITVDIKEVTPKRPKTTDGALKKDSDTQWTYTPFRERKREKHPAAFKTVKVVGIFEESEVATDHFFVLSVFAYLGFDISPHQDRERAWRYARWKYDISTANLTSITYDRNLPKRGLTRLGFGGIGRHATLGRGAFESENICASVLGHENVHGGQPWWYFLPGMEARAEIPAYQWEINNARRTGIPRAYIQECRQWIRYYQGRGPRPK